MTMFPKLNPSGTVATSFWISALTINAAVFILTLRKALRYRKGSNATLLAVLLRDGV
jgi:hypothetical protein